MSQFSEPRPSIINLTTVSNPLSRPNSEITSEENESHSQENIISEVKRNKQQGTFRSAEKQNPIRNISSSNNNKNSSNLNNQNRSHPLPPPSAIPQQFSPSQLNTILSHHHKNNLHSYSNKQNLHQTQQSSSDTDDDSSSTDSDLILINSNSIVHRYQLILIACLILTSVTSITFSIDGTLSHIKEMTLYFNSAFLGNDNLSLYDQGDNIDEPKVEIAIYEDMVDHFENLLGEIEGFYGDDGFAMFEQELQENIELEVRHKHRRLNGDQYSTSEEKTQKEQGIERHLFDKNSLQLYLADQNMRQFILNLQEMRISISFGSNKHVGEMNLELHYQTFSHQMLQVSLRVDHQPNPEFIPNKNTFTVRILEQLLAFCLLCSYLHNSYTIHCQNIRLKQLNIFYSDVETLQKNRLYWCYSLVCLNLLTIFSTTLAPLMSFLQLLPIFEKHDSSTNHYNFNTNLRYTIPIVLRIFIPVVILLNGFIFYSLLMYPGKYFDDYILGFFSYIYQNFQVGTYEIFEELKSRGNFAYFLYGILYFYMVLVGNNLFPALFCTLIYIKMSEKDLKVHIRRTINSAACPKCNSKHFVEKEDKKNFEININSPKISPYLKGKLLSTNKSNLSKRENLNENRIGSPPPSPKMRMFVEDEDRNKLNSSLNMSEFMKAKVERIKILNEKLMKLLKPNDYKLQSIQVRQYEEKISKCRQVVY